MAREVVEAETVVSPQSAMKVSLAVSWGVAQAEVALAPALEAPEVAAVALVDGLQADEVHDDDVRLHAVVAAASTSPGQQPVEPKHPHQRHQSPR